MRERPTLERMNIPIAALLKSPSVRDAVHSICRTQCVNDRFLAGAAVTFRQLSLLSSDTRIPGETLKLILNFWQKKTGNILCFWKRDTHT